MEDFEHKPGLLMGEPLVIPVEQRTFSGPAGAEDIGIRNRRKRYRAYSGPRKFTGLM